MLQHTFCHISGIGLKSEREIWDAGVHSWYDLLNGANLSLRRPNINTVRERLRDSVIQLNLREPKYFAKGMPSDERWRLYRDFQDDVCYIDIETTGSGRGEDHITTIALYDGKDVRHYIYGRNLEQFAHDIWDYRVVVTYNGRCFDIPYINKYFNIRMNHAHIDLRFVLASLGYRGGLKGCEKQLGLDRDDLNGVNGYFAVLLWEEYVRNKSEEALETLVAYNVLDAVNLEPLMVIAYNEKLKETPFEGMLELPVPDSPVNPFQPHRPTIDAILTKHSEVFEKR